MGCDLSQCPRAHLRVRNDGQDVRAQNEIVCSLILFECFEGEHPRIRPSVGNKLRNASASSVQLLDPFNLWFGVHQCQVLAPCGQTTGVSQTTAAKVQSKLHTRSRQEPLCQIPGSLAQRLCGVLRADYVTCNFIAHGRCFERPADVGDLVESVESRRWRSDYRAHECLGEPTR